MSEYYLVASFALFSMMSFATISSIAFTTHVEKGQGMYTHFVEPQMSRIPMIFKLFEILGHNV